MAAPASLDRPLYLEAMPDWRCSHVLEGGQVCGALNWQRKLGCFRCETFLPGYEAYVERTGITDVRGVPVHERPEGAPCSDTGGSAGGGRGHGTSAGG